MSTTTITKKRNVRKRAVCVGIDEFAFVNGLSGCVNDCLDMAETLKGIGFPRTHIKILTNENATKADIMKAIAWLTADAMPGDVLVYYHSGHGTQIADLSGDEEDRIDEAIVCHDFDWTEIDGQISGCITDDELYNVFTGKVQKGVLTDVVLDTCFSGSGTRSIFRLSDLEKDPKSKAYRKQRYLPPPPEHMFIINDTNPSTADIHYFSKNILEGENKKSKDIVEQNNVLWAAAQDFQESWEVYFSATDTVRGAFTYFFCVSIRAQKGTATRGDLYRGVKAELYNSGFDQIPALEVPTPEAENLRPFKKLSEQ